MSGLGTAPPLPLDIAFLAHRGVAPGALAEIAAKAARIGVEPAHELIVSGLLDEQAFYRALASELRVPFHSDEMAFMPGGDYGAILRQGMAAVNHRPEGKVRFAMAPTGAVLRRVIERGLVDRDDVVMMTPTAFAASLRQTNAAGLARHVAGLDRIATSARTGPSRGQRIVAGLVAGPALLGGCLAPFETIVACALAAWPFFVALAMLRLAGVVERQDPDLWRTHRWRLDDARLPVYTVAVPLFRAVKVLPKLLAALSNLDYPPAKLDIRLLVETGDFALRAALAKSVLPAHIAVTLVPPGAPQTKPRALNLALLEARGALMTIYDAEDVPDPAQLRIAAARFAKAPADLVCLQARLVIDNGPDGLLQKLFALEYAGLFDVLNPGLLRNDLPIMLGGTSNHFRTSALREIGGWDAWNVTEDADLAVRLVRAGLRIGDMPSVTLEEAPASVHVWLKQRMRWMKGYLQTVVSHLQQPQRLIGEAGFAATVTLLALSLGSLISALGYPVFVAVFALALLDGSLMTADGHVAGFANAMALVIAGSGFLAIMLPPVLGAVRRGMPELLPLVPLLPLYYGLVSLAAWLALVEYALRPHHWNKTEHGLARSSRHGSLTDVAAIRQRPRPAVARC